MMILRSCLGVIFGLALSASAALAADGSSGCGPAWYVFKDISILSSSLRSTTNGILWPTTTIGMTFGTSNCAAHKLVDNADRESVQFATLAYHDLILQMAQGRGEHLAAFASTLGCPWQAQDDFNGMLQNAYPDIFPSDEVEPEDIVAHVRAQIRNHPTLAPLCTVGVG